MKRTALVAQEEEKGTEQEQREVGANEQEGEGGGEQGQGQEGGVKGGKCVICGVCVARYRCPAEQCARGTCSLACCVAHKARFSCDGRRDRTAFVALKAFSDRQLSRDVFFLEDAARVVQARGGRLLAGAAHQRDAEGEGRRESKRRKVPAKAQALVSACRKRGTKLQVMAAGLSKHEANTTALRRAAPAEPPVIHWRLDLQFMDTAGDKVSLLVYPQCPETHTWAQALEAVTGGAANAVRRAKLLRRVPSLAADAVAVVMAAEGVPVRDRAFFLLAMDQPIQETLVGKTIVEHPSLLIVPRADLSRYGL